MRQKENGSLNIWFTEEDARETPSSFTAVTFKVSLPGLALHFGVT